MKGLLLRTSYHGVWPIKRLRVAKQVAQTQPDCCSWCVSHEHCRMTHEKRSDREWSGSDGHTEKQECGRVTSSGRWIEFKAKQRAYVCLIRRTGLGLVLGWLLRMFKRSDYGTAVVGRVYDRSGSRYLRVFVLPCEFKSQRGAWTSHLADRVPCPPSLRLWSVADISLCSEWLLAIVFVESYSENVQSTRNQASQFRKFVLPVHLSAPGCNQSIPAKGLSGCEP